MYFLLLFIYFIMHGLLICFLVSEKFPWHYTICDKFYNSFCANPLAGKHHANANSYRLEFQVTAFFQIVHSGI